MLERPGRASAIAVQLPGPPIFWICSRRSASSCGIRRGVFGEGQHDDVHGDLRPRNTSRRCRGARNPDRSTPSSWQKLFLTVVCRGSDWRGRGRGEVRHPGMERTSGVHEFFTILSSSSVTLLIVACVVCGACAGVCPRGFRGKFLTDCVTVGSKPDAEKKESRVGRKDAGPACSTFLPNC